MKVVRAFYNVPFLHSQPLCQLYTCSVLARKPNRLISNDLQWPMPANTDSSTVLWCVEVAEEPRQHEKCGKLLCDSALKWPFKGRVNIKLLNQIENRRETWYFADDIPNGCVGSKVKIGQVNLNYHHAFSFNYFGFQGDIKEAKYLVDIHCVCQGVSGSG